MKHSKLLKTGIVLALSAVSLNANAISARAGLDACAKAMVDDLASGQGSPIAYSVDPEIVTQFSKLGSREVFHLDAMNKNGGEVVARIDCIVNQKAEVTQLIKVPLDGEEARIRSTTYN